MAGWSRGARAGARAREGPPVGRWHTVAIATAGHLLLAVVVVAARQQVACAGGEAVRRRGGSVAPRARRAGEHGRVQGTKDKLGHVDPVLLVDDHRDTLAVVVHRDATRVAVNVDLELIHRRVALLVVSRVDEDLVEYLVQARNVRHLLLLHPPLIGVHAPHFVRVHLDRPHIGVRALKNVLVLGELLVRLLDRLLALGRLRRRVGGVNDHVKHHARPKAGSKSSAAGWLSFVPPPTPQGGKLPNIQPSRQIRGLTRGPDSKTLSGRAVSLFDVFVCVCVCTVTLASRCLVCGRPTCYLVSVSVCRVGTPPAR